MNPTLPIEDVRTIEAIEASVLEQMHDVATPSMVSALGLGMAKLGAVTMSWAPAVDNLMYNRALGVGLKEAATETLLDDVLDHFRRAGSQRYFVQIAPGALPRELPWWLEARGLVLHNRWAKLHRDAGASPHAKTDWRIEAIDRSEAGTFGEIVAGAFGHGEPLSEWYASMVGLDGWRHYLAFDGTIGVAAAAMYVANGIANFSFAGTREAYRGRGAQGALIARRIRDAAELGCRKLVVETAEDTAEKPSPSFRNVRRFGFELAYLRPNYMGKADDGSRSP